MLCNALEVPMLSSIRNLKVSEIELRQELPELECAWLVRRLRAHPDVSRARCGSDARHLAVEYDADRLGGADLEELLTDCGVRVVGMQPSRI
jgi:hypothetical protein